MAAKHETLDLDVDEKFQRTEWRVQRGAWIIWCLILLAALAGLTGSGPLSHASQATSNGNLTIDYDRFVRHGHHTRIKLYVKNEEAARPVAIKLSQSLLDGIMIHRIEPEPASRELSSDGAVYTFAAASDATGQSSQIDLLLEYEGVGRLRGQIGIVGEEPILLNQFVYP
jgi:hypothetical protein